MLDVFFTVLFRGRANSVLVDADISGQALVREKEIEEGTVVRVNGIHKPHCSGIALSNKANVYARRLLKGTAVETVGETVLIPSS